MSMGAAISVMESSKGSSGILSDGELDKPKRAYELRMKGVPIANIASSFGVDNSTIYRWLSKYRDAFAQEFTARPRFDILLDSLAFLRAVRDTAMAEAHRIDLEAHRVDEAGKVVSAGPIDRNAKHKMLSLAVDAESKSFTMLAKTGVLPTVAKEIYYSVEETKPIAASTKDKVPVTREELTARLLELVSNQSQLPPVTLVEEPPYEYKSGVRAAGDAGPHVGNRAEEDSEAPGSSGS